MALYSKPNKKMRRRNSSEEAMIGVMQVNPAAERERKRQLDVLKATTDLRMLEAEENVKQQNEELRCQMMD